MVERDHRGEKVRISEYADVRGPVSTEEVLERTEKGLSISIAQERERSTLGERMGSFLSRTIGGGPSQDEIMAARREREEAAWTYRSDQSFASSVASRTVRQSDADVRRLVPGLGSDPLPRERFTRWVAIGRAALDIAHDHVERGDDHRLGPDMGRMVRLKSLDDNARRFDIALAEPARSLLESDSERTAQQIRNYMSAGPEVMAAITRQAMSISNSPESVRYNLGMDDGMPDDPILRQEWTRDRLLERHAKARAGGTDDLSIMKEAASLDSHGKPAGDCSRDGTYVRPDAARTAAAVSARAPEQDRQPGVAQSQTASIAAARAAQMAGRDR